MMVVVNLVRLLVGMGVFKTEEDSVKYFNKVLQARGYTDIKRTDKFCYYDIEACKGDKSYRFELKRRNFKHTRYGDAVMEAHKFNHFIEDRDKYNYCYLVSFFEDCWTISNIKSPIGGSVIFGSRTTDFEDKTIIKKDFVHYRQQVKFRYNLKVADKLD